MMPITCTSCLIYFLVLMGFLFLIMYGYSKRNIDYWQKMHVSGPKPLPLVGNILDVLSFKTSIGNFFRQLYNSSDEPYVGFFIFDEPCLLVRSPAIVKQVLAVDHKHFEDRTVAASYHDLFRTSIFALKGQEWKKTKSLLSKGYSIGKISKMFLVMKDSGDDMINYLKTDFGAIWTTDAKEVCRKYTIDVITRCFFGVNDHLFESECSQFEEVGRKMFSYTKRNGFSQTMCFFKNNIVKLFNLQFFDRGVQDFFISTCQEIMKVRRQLGIQSNDLLAVLMELGDSEAFDLRRISGLSMEFFGVSFQSTSSNIAFTLYEMAVNPHIQQKLRKEITTKLKNKDISEELVNEMVYLDRCIKETQRKYPSLPFLDRRCTRDYHVPGTDLVLKKGTAVYVPTVALQNDEKYFTEPERYNPDRFQENINENETIFIPFGYGPRTCLGKRFGLLVVKLALIQILNNFEVERTSETPVPVVYDPKSFTTQSVVGLPLKFRRMV